MRKLFFLFFISFMVGCSTKEQAENHESVKQILPETLAEVTVDTLKFKVFSNEIVSNGQLTSANVAELRFQLSEPVAAIYVYNGQRVSVGQKIASLQSYSSENKLRQAENELERTRLELQDVLIGQGYKLKDTASIDKEMMQLMAIKSGYARALNQYKIALYDKEQNVLKAPIGGVVANLKAQKHTLANTSEAFCHIVDLNKMKVSFSVLENELGMIKKGNKVEITPYAMPEVKMRGNITEINPWVDENGMIAIKASVSYHPKMVEGMNVKVSIYRSLKKQLVVPKSAVVLRTGKQVIFAYREGKALWHYVTTAFENASSYTITSETLKEGDIIITTGNVNLAHESKVKIVEE